MLENLILVPIWACQAVIWATIIFLEVAALLDVRNCPKLELREILNAYSDNNAPQTFEHVVRINRSISCSGLNCKTPIMIGDQCVKVDGALSVPFGREYAVKKLFFFCPKRLCITRPPVWSNILITHPLAIIKGDNIPDEDHERLMEDMKNSY